MASARGSLKSLPALFPRLQFLHECRDVATESNRCCEIADFRVKRLKSIRQSLAGVIVRRRHLGNRTSHRSFQHVHIRQGVSQRSQHHRITTGEVEHLDRVFGALGVNPHNRMPLAAMRTPDLRADFERSPLFMP